MHPVVGRKVSPREKWAIVSWMRVLQASLDEPLLDDEILRARMSANFTQLERFARGRQAHASERHPSLARFVTAEPTDDQVAQFGELILEPVAAAR